MTDTYEQARNGADSDPEGERIVVEIEETRSDMAGTIDEIGHRLQPQTIANEAVEKVRDATVGKVERMMGDAGQSVQKTGNSMADTIRQNPVPAALAAIGIGWLALKMRDQQSSNYSDAWRYRAGSGYRSGDGYRTADGYRNGRDFDSADDPMQRARQATQDVTDQASQRAQQLGTDVQRVAQDAFDGTQERFQQAQWQVDRTWNDNPLALGALAVGVGAAVALAIPETQKERELLGDQRDKLVEKVSTVASDALDQAQTKAQELTEKVSESAESNESSESTEPAYSASPSD